MKRIITFCFIALLSTLSLKAQSREEALKEMEGKYSIDDNGNVTYVRIIEVPQLSKAEVYNRALNYFTYNYNSGKSVIQTQDKENGVIVGKGLYNNVHMGISLITTFVSTDHILRIDIKEGKARAILTLTEYEKKIVGGSTPPAYSSTRVSDSYPINEKGGQKNVMAKAFYKSHLRAIASLDAVEKAIKEGSTSKAIEDSKW